MKVVRVKHLDLAFEPQPWSFAVERRAEIDAHFAKLQAEKPATYNGRVLLMHRHELDGETLRGAYLETDFASFISWRDFGNPPPPVWNCFAQGALRGSDGGYLLGVMGEHTANAGKIYFPSGTPDPNDLVGETVDLNASLTREIDEETGLLPGDYTPEAAWICVFAGPRIGLIKTMQLAEPAAAARDRIRANIAKQDGPELSDMYIARCPDDLNDRMPDFIRAYFAHIWQL